MNKKVALFLAVAIALLSVVIVSTFGLIPEDLRVNIVMTKLSFEDVELMQNQDSTYSKVITMNFKANNNTVYLYDKVKFEPADTTNIVVQYYSDQPTDKVTISASGIVTIYDYANLTSFVVYIKSTDGSNLVDSIIIRKPSSNESFFGEDFEWG